MRTALAILIHGIINIVTALHQLYYHTELRPSPFTSMHESSYTTWVHGCPASCARSKQYLVEGRKRKRIV